MEFNNELIQKIYTTTNGYIEGIKKFEAETKEIRSNYKGEALNSKMTVHKETMPNKGKVLDELKACKNDLDYQLALLTDNALDSTKITKDYELLQLPVTLSNTEIIKLNERNADNPIFTRALIEYCAKHNIEDVIIEDSITRRKNEIDSFYKAHEGIIMKDDIHGINDLEIGGAYEKWSEW